MATEVNTNVAQELNITHRKNDSFELQVSILDSKATPTTSFDLSQAQGGTDPLFGLNSGIMPQYQAKMTIKKAKSQHESLNIYSYYWKDIHGLNLIPTKIQTGSYHGEQTAGVFSSAAGNQSPVYAGIYLLSSTGSNADEVIWLKAPSRYMSFDVGEYIYDLQIRRKDTYSPLNDTGAIYTTWLYGTFTLTSDVTQV
jgi:hypothetical protein